MTYIILMGQCIFFSATKGAGMVGKAGKFMLDMGVTAKRAAVGGAVLTGTQSFNEQLTLFLRKYHGTKKRIYRTSKVKSNGR